MCVGVQVPAAMRPRCPDREIRRRVPQAVNEFRDQEDTARFMAVRVIQIGTFAPSSPQGLANVSIITRTHAYA